MNTLLADKNNKLDINLYQIYLKDLYSEANKDRDFADIYGYLHRNVGYLGKSIELNIDDYSKFILPISWLLSLATKLDINILDAFIKRYPGICPYCLERHCVCYQTNKKPLKPRQAYEIEETIYFKWEEVKNGQVVFNLDKAVNFVSDIYPYNEVVWKSAGYHSHILRIHEEMVDIHEAYSHFKSDKEPVNTLMDEVADVFAWILAAWAIKYPKESLDSAFIDYYINGCPVCRKAPCACAHEANQRA